MCLDTTLKLVIVNKKYSPQEKTQYRFWSYYLLFYIYKLIIIRTINA